MFEPSHLKSFIQNINNVQQNWKEQDWKDYSQNIAKFPTDEGLAVPEQQFPEIPETSKVDIIACNNNNVWPRSIIIS